MDSNNNRIAAEVFVLRLARSLHTYGAPAHRVEELTREMLRSCDLEGEIMVAHTQILAAFGPPGFQRTSMVRVAAGNVDLAKLCAVEDIARGVEQDKLTPGEGTRRLLAVDAATGPYPPAAAVVGFAAVAHAAAVSLGASRGDAILSLGVGAVVGLLAVTLPRLDPLESAVVPLVSGVSAFLALALDAEAPMLVAVAALIVMVPGFSAKVAMTELSTGNLQSGSARLAGVVTVFLQMGLGLAVGRRLGQSVEAATWVPSGGTHPPWAILVALVVAGISFTVLFRARPRDVGWLVLSCGVGFFSARLATETLGPQIGAFCAALVVGVFGNALARLLDRPAAVWTLPGVMLLVPGTTGFRSVTSFLDRDVLLAVDAAFEMTMLAAALAAGIIFSNLLVAPRSLPSPRGADGAPVVVRGAARALRAGWGRLDAATRRLG